MASRHKKKKRAKKASRRHDNDTPTRSDELRNDFWLPTIKRRRRFSNKEIKLLQKEFSVNCSPCADKVEEIAHLFSTDKKIITTWFQNKRAKTKKLQASSPSSPRTVSTVDDRAELEQPKEEDEVDFDDSMTELSSTHTDMDSDTFHVLTGDTARTTPTHILHQQEHQNIISTLSSPHYTHQHLSDYLSTYRFDLYYWTLQHDEEDASSFFTYNSNSTTHATLTATSTLSDSKEQDETLWYQLIDSPSSFLCE